MPSRRRTGFSLIEALVVLAISSVALVVIFSIGRSATDSGFRLGRAALAAADSEVALMDARTVMSSLLLVPAAAVRDPAKETIEGTSRMVEAEAVMMRSTICAPRGWRGRVRLSIEGARGDLRLMCQAGEDRPVRLMKLRDRSALFYSTDGVAWQDSWTNASTPDQVNSAPPALESERLYLSVLDPDGNGLVSMISTGLPQSWYVADERL